MRTVQYQEQGFNQEEFGFQPKHHQYEDLTYENDWRWGLNKQKSGCESNSGAGQSLLFRLHGLFFLHSEYRNTFFF